MSEEHIDKNSDSSPEIPTAIIRRRRLSLAWIVPVLALGFVGYMLWSQVAGVRGTMISIRFVDAGGIKPGSAIMHRGVTVGVVREISLTPDLTSVDIRAELTPGAHGLAIEGTKFWVVHPKVSLKGIAGLETLLGPNYIALSLGLPDQPTADSFIGLLEAPAVEPSADGSLRVILQSDRLGTLAAGNPVFYREIRVGTVRDALLTNDARSVMISIDIDPKYRPLVRDNTEFWRSGGVGFDIGIFSGLNVQADSLEAALSASVSFATPKKPGDLAEAGDLFELADEADDGWLKWSPRIEIGP